MNKVVLSLTLGAWAVAGALSAQSLPGELRKEGSLVRAAYEPVTQVFQESCAVIYDTIPLAYGVVVSPDGLILVKASEFSAIESPSVIVGKKRYREFELLATSPEWDVSLLKIPAEGLLPVRFAESEPSHGTMVLSNSGSSRFRRRAQLGIIAANARPVGEGSLAVLGIAMSSPEEEELQVRGVAEESGAKAAGLQAGDIILSVEGQPVASSAEMPDLLAGKEPGEFVNLRIRREIVPEEPEKVEDPFAEVADYEPEFEELELSVELRERQEVFPEQMTRNDMMSGEFSKRRTNFPRVLQHDTSLAERTVGGPLLNLNGECVGMNIAYASRESSYAIPAQELQDLILDLQVRAGLEPQAVGAVEK
ncbi:PDZ domain-containing protein [Roseibacillus ishigakijimensis]|uniref:PDZ domain-containing protein n=1 Tax=Roseibacillus ishigakijimensis TaxID=454146 RepID=A0A934RTE0_9BACT|nr:PDZ domain-containing protein [Roseibacillus ishigakijimensis]MBK1834714.1 PDZ domain-containing protein [Roseibacillus ishigakijimensis]